jgi:nucleoside-diphosphate kinase
MFLKRSHATELNYSELYVGSTVTVYARQLKLVDYGDVFTRQHFAQGKSTTFGMIKPDVYTHTGKIIDSIYKSGFTIGAMKMSRFN